MLERRENTFPLLESYQQDHSAQRIRINAALTPFIRVCWKVANCPTLVHGSGATTFEVTLIFTLCIRYVIFTPFATRVTGFQRWL